MINFPDFIKEIIFLLLIPLSLPGDVSALYPVHILLLFVIPGKRLGIFKNIPDAEQSG